MKDKRLFKASEIDGKRDGWIVDLSPSDCVNPDCFWQFDTREKAERFLKLIGDGMRGDAAYHYATNNYEL